MHIALIPIGPSPMNTESVQDHFNTPRPAARLNNRDDTFSQTVPFRESDNESSSLNEIEDMLSRVRLQSTSEGVHHKMEIAAHSLCQPVNVDSGLEDKNVIEDVRSFYESSASYSIPPSLLDYCTSPGNSPLPILSHFEIDPYAKVRTLIFDRLEMLGIADIALQACPVSTAVVQAACARHFDRH